MTHLHGGENRFFLTTVPAMLTINIVVGAVIGIRAGLRRKVDGTSLSLGALLLGYNYLSTRPNREV